MIKFWFAVIYDGCYGWDIERNHKVWTRYRVRMLCQSQSNVFLDYLIYLIYWPIGHKNPNHAKYEPCDPAGLIICLSLLPSTFTSCGGWWKCNKTCHFFATCAGGSAPFTNTYSAPLMCPPFPNFPACGSQWVSRSFSPDGCKRLHLKQEALQERATVPNNGKQGWKQSGGVREREDK